jgi:carboxylate-amine ligase
MEEDYQQIAREHLICGCHVHIGINDRERAIEIMNRARGWMAPLIALAGNSPFWLGEDTGYSSFRTEIWRRWPMAGSPHIFSSRAEYDALVRTLVETGSISDETKIYWDMRPADRFETLEFRATDVCLTLDEAVLVAGLVRALARTCYELAALDEERGAAFVPVRPELLRASEWRAARYGVEAELLDVHAGKTVPARELIHKLLDFVRPTLEELDEWDEVQTLAQGVLERGNGAMRQRAAWKKKGCLEDVVDLVVTETARGVIE